MNLMIVTGACQHCDAVTPMIYKWQIFSNGMGHIRVDCQDCNTFIKWAKRTEVNMSRADDRVGHLHLPLIDESDRIVKMHQEKFPGEWVTVLNERPPLNRLR
jgi:hypothetical protein